MLKKERQAYILQKVNLHNKVLSSLLCSEINVSEDTIRRDLQELADEGGQARLAEAIRVAFTDHKSDAVVGRYFRTLCSALLESHEVSLWQANDEAARA